MGNKVRNIVLVAAALGLAACASHGGMTSHAPAAAATAGSDSHYARDVAYIATVEKVARRRGVGVHWVNPPVRRVAHADSGQQ